jgi:hypothetical protein
VSTTGNTSFYTARSSIQLSISRKLTTATVLNQTQVKPRRPMPRQLQLFIRGLTPASIVIQIENQFATTYDVGKEIAQRTLIPMDSFFLVFSGRRMDDERSLDSYGVAWDSTIFASPRVRGSPSGPLLIKTCKCTNSRQVPNR